MEEELSGAQPSSHTGSILFRGTICVIHERCSICLQIYILTVSREADGLRRRFSRKDCLAALPVFVCCSVFCY